MPTATKMTFDRLHASRSLLLRARSQADQVTADLTARLTPLLEQGEELPDIAHLLCLLERLLQSHRQRLAEANSTSFHDTGTLTVLLYRRDAAARRLYTELVNVRRAVIGCFGRDAAKVILPTNGRTPRQAGQLMLLARHVIERLSDPQHQLPAAAIPGVQVQPELWAQQLQPHLDELRQILEQIDTARGETVGSVLSKRDALADFDATYGRVARCLETFWDLADGRYKAQKLRPTARHRRHAAFAGNAPTTEARRLPAAIEAPGEPATARIAAGALPEPADAAFPAEPAQATAESAVTPQGGLWARLKAKFRNTRFQEPTEPNSRAKTPEKTVLTGFRSPKSTQHRRPTPRRRPESTGHQRLFASRRPTPPGPPRRTECRRDS